MHKLLLTSFLAALATICPLVAQQPAPAAPVKPAPPAPAAAPVNPKKPATPVAPGDPFVRDPRAPKGALSPAAAPIFHTLVIETYALPTSELAAILAQESSDSARHRLVVALHAAGKARLVGLIAHTAESGIRCLLQSTDEVRYWTEFGPPDGPGGAPTPAAAETTDTGADLEGVLTAGPDEQRVQLQLVLQRKFFHGLREYSYRAGDPPVTTPIFSKSSVVAECDLCVGEPGLVGSASAPREGGDELESWVAFATAKPMKAEPPAKPVKLPLASASIEVALYTLDRVQARQILAEAAPGDIHRRVAALAADGKSQLERLVVCPFRERSVVEQVAEFRYPTEFDPGGIETAGENTHRTVTTSTQRPDEKAGAQGTKETETTETTENSSRTVNDPKAPRIPGHPTAFETRNIGITVDVEPKIDETGVGQAKLDIWDVRNLGTLKVDGVAAKYPFAPLFESRRITQTVPLACGRQVCAGTLNAPPENGVNGRKDDGRTVFVFVRLNCGQP